MAHPQRSPATAAGTATGGRPLSVLKVYDEVRTAHLERLVGTRTTVLYRRRRYDFEAALAEGRDVRRAGVARSLLWALRNRVDVIEVGEPFVLSTAARSLAAIVGNRSRAALRGEARARVVSYAIESIHPDDIVAALPRRARLRRWTQRPLVPLVWRAIDRLVLGTDLAMSVYARSFRGGWPDHRLILALPACRLAATSDANRGQELLFLGDLSERKGFPQLLQVWPRVRERVPGARLTILGRGVGAERARALAADDASVSACIDPPRDEILTTLARSKVLVLPSQRTALWREQVGLPIVEALSFGCAVVTTTETGLAAWLAAHGHEVVAPDDVEALSDAVVRMLEDRRTPAEIAADLPPVDGRAAAEAWLYSGLR